MYLIGVDKGFGITDFMDNYGKFYKTKEEAENFINNLEKNTIGYKYKVVWLDEVIDKYLVYKNQIKALNAKIRELDNQIKSEQFEPDNWEALSKAVALGQKIFYEVEMTDSKGNGESYYFPNINSALEYAERQWSGLEKSDLKEYSKEDSYFGVYSFEVHTSAFDDIIEFDDYTDYSIGVFSEGLSDCCSDGKNPVWEKGDFYRESDVLDNHGFNSRGISIVLNNIEFEIVPLIDDFTQTIQAYFLVDDSFENIFNGDSPYYENSDYDDLCEEYAEIFLEDVFEDFKDKYGFELTSKEKQKCKDVFKGWCDEIIYPAYVNYQEEQKEKETLNNRLDFAKEKVRPYGDMFEKNKDKEKER